MKKNIYITIIAVLTLSNLFSQNESKQTTTEITNANKSKFIFEAVVTNAEVFAGDKNGNKLGKNNIRWQNSIGTFYDNYGNEANGYIKATLTVSKIYKGALSNQTIEVIYKSITIQNVNMFAGSKDSVINFMYVPPSHGADFIILPSFKGQKYLFFCNSITDITNFNFKNKNSTESNIEVVSNISFGNENSDAYASGFNQVFKTKQDLNIFLNSFDGVNANDKSETIEKKSAEKSEEEINNILKQNLINYNKWLQDHSNNLKGKGSNVAAGTLNLVMANPRLLDTLGNNWLEFDILMSASSSSVYFDSFLAHIQYNTSAFGTNMIANNNVIATLVPPFTSPTYTNPNAYWTDNGSNVVVIPFGSSASGPYSRTLCSLTPTKVLTLKFKIQNCSQPANVVFTNTVFTSGFNFYTPTAAGSLTSSIAFSTATYSGNINDQTCVPIITSFNNNVPAGINRTLVINGRYFGKKKGTGTVIFKDANKGTVYPNVGAPYDGGVQPYDIISWNDSQIKVKLPSVIDSVPSGGYVTPGSGKFQVRNFTNTKGQSTTSLTIPYAVYQLPASSPNYTKYNVQLSGKAPNFDYQIRCNPNVATAFPNAPPVIKRAIKEWACNTGINWKLTADTNLASISDGINVINVGNFPALQRTFRDIKFCDLGGGLFRAYERSFDIEINQTPSFGTWQVDSMGTLLAGKYDFYSAMCHELGHGHVLEHINDSIGDVMWFAQYAQGFNQTNRKLVSTSYGATDGGNYMTDSLNLALPCYGNHVQVLPQNCQGLINIKKNDKHLNLVVYPNPVRGNESISIKFEDIDVSRLSYKIFDVTGKVVKENSEDSINQKIINIPISEIPTGLYLIKLKLDNSEKSVKIIKE